MVCNCCASTKSSKWCVRKMRSLFLSLICILNITVAGVWNMPQGGVENIYELNSKLGFKWLSMQTSGPCEFRMQNNHEFCLSLIPAYSMWCESCSVMCNSLRPHGLYRPWNSPGQNIWVGSLSLLQGIFPTQGIFLTQESNPGIPHCRWILYQSSHKGSPSSIRYV